MPIKAMQHGIVVGGMMGYFVVHPLVMITARFMSSSGGRGEELWQNTILEGILASYTTKMVPGGSLR